MSTMTLTWPIFSIHIFIRFIPPAQLVQLILTVSDTMSCISISEADVYYALTSLDPNKAVGLDKIGPRVQRSRVAVLIKPLYFLYLPDMQSSFFSEEYTQCNSCFQIW